MVQNETFLVLVPALLFPGQVTLKGQDLFVSLFHWIC